MARIVRYVWWYGQAGPTSASCGAHWDPSWPRSRPIRSSAPRSCWSDPRWRRTIFARVPSTMRTTSADFAVNERELASNSVPMNRREALAILHDRLPILEPGHVWLVGAGPGDPGMLTLDALAGITQAD